MASGLHDELLADSDPQFIIDRCIAVNDASHTIARGHPDGADMRGTHRLLLTPDTVVPPSGTTFPALDVVSTQALPLAVVNAANQGAGWRIEYGVTTNFGFATPYQSMTGTIPQLVNAQLSNLLPHTAYYSRVVVTNATGFTHGSTVTFTTPWNWSSWSDASLNASDPRGDANTNNSPAFMDYATGNQPEMTITKQADPSQISFHRATNSEGATMDVQISTNLLGWQDGTSYSMTEAVSSNEVMVEISRQALGEEVEVITIEPYMVEDRIYLRLKAQWS